jgi:hypothetical protein
VVFARKRNLRNDPAINFLSRDSQAEWIVFPAAVDSRAYGFASLDATFRREFSLENQPASAHMSIRAMRRVEVKITGTHVQFPPISNWKKIVTTDVAARLRAGTNVIEARVFNYNGPPALWLRLTTDQLSLRRTKLGKHHLRVLPGDVRRWPQGRKRRAQVIPSPAASIRSTR